MLPPCRHKKRFFDDAHGDNLCSTAGFVKHEHRHIRYAIPLCGGHNARLEVAKCAVFIDVYQIGAGGGTRTRTTFPLCLKRIKPSIFNVFKCH